MALLVDGRVVVVVVDVDVDGGGAALTGLPATAGTAGRAVGGAGASQMVVPGASWSVPGLVTLPVTTSPHTLSVTTDDMAHHVAAVARTRPRPLVVGDLPWLSYHVSRSETVTNAAKLIRAGAGAVKLEGGRKRLESVEAILDAEIPVMGHLGLTPQSVHALGGFRVQGKALDAARVIVEDAVALADAGCFAIVLECVPDAVARMVTDAVPVPTIGIGAGRHCDGQVLVYHDLLGLEDRVAPRFVRRYASLREDATTAVERFADDVRSGRFPSSDETYHMTDRMAEALGLYGAGAIEPELTQ